MLHIIFNRLLASISAHIILIIRQQTVKKIKEDVKLKTFLKTNYVQYQQLETYAILSKKHLPRKMYRYQFQQPKIHSQVCILNAWFKEYTGKFNELIFFYIYTQSYYLFCVNVNVINNRILDHLFHISITTFIDTRYKIIIK